MTEPPPPLVSVCVTTYNNEEYIHQAIESVLVQETDFPVEILIGEDVSTDSTRGLVLELERKHPQTIRAILASTNLGPYENLARLLKESKGKYIALLDGDDLWTSPQKLKKQVAFLDQHPECTICFHRVERYLQAEDRVLGVWPDKDPATVTTIEDLIRQNYMSISSVIYQNVVKIIPESSFRLTTHDWPLHILHAQKGNIGFLAETLARYRIHSTSIFSSLNARLKTEAVLKAREFMYPFLAEKHRKILGPVILEYCYQLARMSLEDRDFVKARHYLARGMRYFRHFGLYNGRTLYLKLYLQVYSPRRFSRFR
jgi:glycosyltransferase involved in cell wall biosynthesis